MNRQRKKPRFLFNPRFGIYFVVAAVFCIGITVLLGYGPGDGARNGALSKIAPISVRLNASIGPKFAGEIVALREKVFEDNGIDVEFREHENGIDAIDLVVRGVDTFGVIDSVSFLSARAVGKPVVAFAAGLLERADVFYATERSGIRNLRDFLGKRVGRSAGTNSAIFYDALIKSAGMSRSQIQESATETGLDALINASVDVIPGRIGEEGFLLHQRGVAYTVVRISDYGIHVPDTVYFTTEKMIREHPSLVLRFLQSVVVGWGRAYADLAKSVPLIVEASKELTADRVRFELAAQRDFVMPVSRRVAEFDEQQWKQLRLILNNARLLDGSVDLRAAINYDIVKEAYRKPVTFGK